MPEAAISNPRGAFGQTKVVDRTVTEFVASGTVTRGLFVSITGEGTVADTSTVSHVACVGVALNSATTGQTVRVVTRGQAEVTANVTIAAGAQVSAAANGKCAASVAPSATAKNMGICMVGGDQDETLVVWITGS